MTKTLISLPSFPMYAATWHLQARQVAVQPSSSRCQFLSPSLRPPLPSGPFCLGSQWISLSFHHSLMSSCSCQHLLTAGNSSLHTGSWDPCDELQSAIRKGGCTLSSANQGKLPFQQGRGCTDRLSPSLPHNYPLIAPPQQAGASDCGKRSNKLW